MKAIILTSFGGPEVMKYTDVDIPAISKDQVLIRVVATSVNFADIKSRYGKKGNKSLPFIPGIDAAGIVERVGSHVKNIHPGQRVIAFPQNGSYAEYVVANENLTLFYLMKSIFKLQLLVRLYLLQAIIYSQMLQGFNKANQYSFMRLLAELALLLFNLQKLLGAGKVIGTVGSEAKKKLL